jgi:hypothetical protein
VRLATVLRERQVRVLTSVSEPIGVALWHCRDRLPAGMEIVAVRPDAAAQLESKRVQDRLARDAGLDVLPSWIFGPGSAASAADVPAQAFPLAVRPDIARRADPAFKIEVVHDAAQLARLVGGLGPHSCSVVAQPLVRGPNLLVHAWRSADGQRRGHLAFEVDLKHRGLTVAMRPVPLPPAIAAGCRRIEDVLGLSGVFHYEFIVDERSGRACFLDLNPRLGGTTGKALAAGYDEPMALLATVLPQGLTEERFVARRLKRVAGKHQALRALWSTLRGTRSAADYPSAQRGRAVRELLACLFARRDEIVRLDELRSSLAFALCKLSAR